MRRTRHLGTALRHLLGIGIAVVTAAVVLLHPWLRLEPAAPTASAQESAFNPWAESRLLHLVNRTRSRFGLRPLVMTRALQIAAREHSQDMAIRGYVGHDTPEGITVRDRLARVIKLPLLVGENVATGQSAEQAHRALVASPAHLRNILAAKFHRVGIGIVFGEQRGLIITEDFSE